MVSQLYRDMGFHTCASLDRESTSYRKASQKKVIVENMFKAGSYIPGIGLATGSLVLLFVCKDRDTSLTDRIHFGIRGVLSILGAGILMAIPDLIVTIHRFLCQKAPDSHLNSGPRSSPHPVRVTPQQRAQYHRQMQNAPMELG